MRYSAWTASYFDFSKDLDKSLGFSKWFPQIRNLAAKASCNSSPMTLNVGSSKYNGFGRKSQISSINLALVERHHFSTYSTLQRNKNIFSTTMKSTIRSGIFASLLLGLFLGVALQPRGVQSFVPTQRVHNQQYSVSLASESEGAASTEDFTPPPKPVKCPNCDMCDGSGRYERSSFAETRPTCIGQIFCRDEFVQRLVPACCSEA